MENEKIVRLKSIYNLIDSFGSTIRNEIEKGIIKKIEFFAEGKMQIVLSEEHNNLRMILNSNDFEEVPYAILANGDFEKDETKMIRKIVSLLPNDMVCFDIGANVGWYTLHVLKERSDAKVYSFEPGPLTFERLISNMKVNNFLTDNCINVGFFNSEGTMDFYYDPNGSGASSMVNLRNKDNVQKLTVAVSTIDSWIDEQKIDRLDFIKCDVEGSELFVYQGGMESIKKFKPIVFSEMLRKWAAKFGYHPNDIIELYRNMNYGCYVITEDERLKEVLEVTEDTLETNYFFIHKEKHEAIIRALT